MQQVHERFAQAKETYVKQLRANELEEISHLSSFIKVAKENGLDVDYTISALKDKLSEKLKQMANASSNIPSDQEFVKWRLDNKLYGQLTNNSTARSSPEAAKDNQKV